MVTISVYLDDGVVKQYDVFSHESAREHVSAIIKTGYRSTDNGTATMVHYPPHRILKVKASGEGISTNYPDRMAGT